MPVSLTILTGALLFFSEVEGASLPVRQLSVKREGSGSCFSSSSLSGDTEAARADVDSIAWRDRELSSYRRSTSRISDSSSCSLLTGLMGACNKAGGGLG